MADLNYPDPSASPWTDPNGVVWEHNGIGWRKKSVSSLDHAETLLLDAPDSHPAAAISGLSLPNMLFNADFLILDHGGGNRTPGINVYGFNRWRGSAIGLKQTIEGASITSGNYTLSWGGGTGNGSLNGVAAASPITTVLSADVDANAEVPSDATWAKLEFGDARTIHLRRDIGEDLIKCLRYAWFPPMPSGILIDLFPQATAPAVNNRIGTVFYPVQMRVIPSVSYTVSNGATSHSINNENIRITAVAATTAQPSAVISFSADAEIYD